MLLYCLSFVIRIVKSINNYNNNNSNNDKNDNYNNKNQNESNSDFMLTLSNLLVFLKSHLEHVSL